MTENINTEISENAETEKLFTRKELEKIVEQRLLRDRKNTESLTKIRELLVLLRQNDAFKKLSNAAIAKKLGELAEKVESADEVEEVSPDSDSTDPVPTENAETAETLVGKEAFDQTQTAIDGELLRFFEKYDEEKLFEILKDSSFRRFSRGRRGDLLEVYEDYLGFLSELSDSSDAKRYRAAQRQLCSTGFSEGASCATDYGSMLSENQRRIAKAAGMSYRHYAQLLSQIPSKKL